MEVIKLKDDYIKLGQALKAAGCVGSGVESKIVIKEGQVTVNGEVEYQRGKSSMMEMWLLSMAKPLRLRNKL